MVVGSEVRQRWIRKCVVSSGAARCARDVAMWSERPGRPESSEWCASGGGAVLEGFGRAGEGSRERGSGRCRRQAGPEFRMQNGRSRSEYCPFCYNGPMHCASDKRKMIANSYPCARAFQFQTCALRLALRTYSLRLARHSCPIFTPSLAACT